jgi:hypothetical protein
MEAEFAGANPDSAVSTAAFNDAKAICTLSEIHTSVDTRKKFGIG